MDEGTLRVTYNDTLKGSSSLMILFHFRCAIIVLYGIDLKRVRTTSFAAVWIAPTCIQYLVLIFLYTICIL
jgi:hypothetical protein